MLIKQCCCCGVLLFFYPDGVNAPWVSGSFCGCPYYEGKYRKFYVGDGVLVVFDEVEV